MRSFLVSNDHERQPLFHTWLTPMLQYFEQHPPRDFPNYEPGSWGPEICEDWIRHDRRTWREL